MNFYIRRLIHVLGLTAVLTLPGAIGAAEHEAHGDDSPLHENMEEMGRGMRTINKALTGDPAAAKADVLAAVQKMQLLAVEAKVLVPATIEKLPEAERPAKLAEYRTDLAGTIVVMLEFERAVLADNWTLAKESFAKLREARKQGHEKFNPEE